MEKYIEDARQEEKDVPDLLEAIMRPTDPVKEELRHFFFKRVFEPLTLLLQDQWVSLLIPADPGRVFHPVWRPQYIFHNKKVCFS